MKSKDLFESQWPLFKTSVLADGSISLDTNKGIWTLKSFDSLTDAQRQSLNKTHSELAICQDLMNKYPSLYISWREKAISVWVKAFGRDREGLGEVSHSDPKEMHRCLEILEKKVAIISKNPNVYFLCSGCDKCLYMNKEAASSHKINRLIDDEAVYFKFQPPSANYYCEKCVKTDPYAKSQYELSLKMGSSYYD